MAVYWEPIDFFVSKQDEAMEIVMQDSPPQELLIDSLEDSEDPQEKPKQEARFKSSRTQRTDLETWKRPEKMQDFTTNVHMESGGGNEGEQQTEEVTQDVSREDRSDDSNQVTQDKLDSQDFGDFAQSDKRKPLQLPGSGGGSGRAQVPPYVQESMPPGVRLGNITSLNTDQHRFYSFNQRLITRFIPIWGRQVRQALYQWLKNNEAPGVSKSWVTNVEIIMNSEGEILDVQPFRLSGLWSIDEAAINSFNKIRQVPNPPKELIDDNGYIHIQFQTEVYWVPQPGRRYHGGNP